MELENMSEVLVRVNQERGRPLFKPSIAQEGCHNFALANQSSALADQASSAALATPHPSKFRFGAAALWAFQLTSAFHAGFASPSAAVVSMPHWALPDLAVENPASRPHERAVESTSQELVATLKAKGMPVAALSEVLDVERKTIYSWLDEGRDANPANHERLQLVHGLLSGEVGGSLRFFHRFWDRKLPEVGSLRSTLTNLDMDSDAVCTALELLRPAVLRAMVADAGRRASAESKSPAASLTLQLQATT